jgi:hypothetical protein
MAAVAYEYQSIYRIHIPGTEYSSADEVLNDEGLDGWELVSVVVVSAIYDVHSYEIFYLKRIAPKVSEQ